MIFANHSVFACRGFWLPNDGRGSWSTEVWAPHLKPFGPATKTTERRSLANKPHDRAARQASKDAMIFPAVVLNQQQRECVARGFEKIIPLLGLVVYACAIMPDHVHLVLKRHQKHVEELIGFLKRAATRQLTEEGLHPLAGFINRSGRVPSPWVDGGWNRFIDDHRLIEPAADYVVKNPLKIGLSRQSWPFVSLVPHVVYL
jgi:REP element-mobilizing transposase RayT